MKRVLAIIVASALLLVGVYVIGTGLTVCNGVFVEDYILSADGGTLSLHVGVASSIGFIRSVSVKEKGEELQLTFRSAFGGINGKIGARDVYEIPLSADVNRISVRQNTEYREVLYKDAHTGEWLRR